MHVSDFQLERAAFELRYPQAYLLWDRAGSIWSEAVRRWPALKLVRGEPSHISFTLENQHELAVTLEKANAVSHFPAMSTFVQLADTFTGLVTQHLELDHYIRIGLRLFYFRAFPSREEASKAAVSIRILNPPEGRHFGIEPPYLLPECAFRLEGPSIGVTIRLRAEGRVVDFQPPMNARGLKPHHAEDWGVLFDVDYYTLANVTIGQFKAEDWINSAVHVIRRDSEAFLGGH
jgi:hypothetical protein